MENIAPVQVSKALDVVKIINHERKRMKKVPYKLKLTCHLKTHSLILTSYLSPQLSFYRIMLEREIMKN